MDLISLKEIPPWEWPSNAGETLMKIIGNGKSAPADRVDAAELAGDLVVMNDQIADLLLSTVENGSEPTELRATAAISLGAALEQTDLDGFDDPYLEPPISEVTFDEIRIRLRRIYQSGEVPKEVRRRVLEASVRAPEDWHRDAVRAAYSSSDPDWKLTATFCMRWFRGFDQEILEALESRNPDIRLEAVHAAGNQGVKAAWPHISALFAARKTPKPLLLAAIGAAAYVNPEEASDILTELAGSRDPEIAEAASEGLLECEAGAFEDEDEGEDELPGYIQ